MLLAGNGHRTDSCHQRRKSVGFAQSVAAQPTLCARDPGSRVPPACARQTLTTMGTPVVYFDMTIGGAPAGRIEMTLRADVVPKTAEVRRLDMRALARHLSDNTPCILPPPPPSASHAPVVGLLLTLSARARLQSQAERFAPLHGRTSVLCARARRAWARAASRSTSRAPPSTASSRSSCARAATSRAATAAPARVQGTPSFPPAQFTARPSSGGRRRAAGCSARARAALSPEPLRSAELWQRPQRAALDTPRCARERQG